MNAAQKDCADAKCQRPSNDQHDHHFGDEIEGWRSRHCAKDLPIEEQDAELQEAECEDADEVEEVLYLRSHHQHDSPIPVGRVATC